MKRKSIRQNILGINMLLPWMMVLMFPVPLRTEISKPFYASPSQRQNITFILGEDQGLKNPFYSKAEQYYRMDEKEKTEFVITSCRSLAEVQEYLLRHVPRDQPWGLINLVSHGNPYQGLRAKVTPNGKRASPESIFEGLAAGELKKMPARFVDNKTRISLHACGLGYNRELTEAVQAAFSGPVDTPVVKSSKYFEYYVGDAHAESNIRKFMADYWLISYKMGYRPSDRIIARMLRNKYPGQKIKWREALLKERANKAGEVFHYTFDVPVKWVFPYSSRDSVPDLRSQRECLEWVNRNSRILQDLKTLDIPSEKFNWWMRRIYLRNDDGSSTPALWVKGYSTILCVLKLLPA